MLSGLLTSALKFVLKLGFGSAVDKLLSYLERTASTEVERERIRTSATVEIIRSAVNEVQTMADLNKAKFQFPWFWVLISLFVVPLAGWWTAVLADSVFGFPFQVADLPNEHMVSWAGDMIRWLFYVGTGVGAVKLVTR